MKPETPVSPEEAHNEASDDGTYDADDDIHQCPLLCIGSHNEGGDPAGEGSEDDPENDSHTITIKAKLELTLEACRVFLGTETRVCFGARDRLAHHQETDDSHMQSGSKPALLRVWSIQIRSPARRHSGKLLQTEQ